MNTEQVRKIFDSVAQAHRNHGDHDRAAQTELVREYFTNPKFKKTLEEVVWQLNQARQ